MKEESPKNKSFEVLAWVNRSRKIEEKRNADQGESDDEEAAQHTAQDLAGVKVLHSLEKVIEGGTVILTLEDHNLLADGDINEEVDMFESVEIREQMRRDEAYISAKKKMGIYEDKFNDDSCSEKKILPQYDNRGRFTGGTQKKLEVLNSLWKVSSDYYTHEEMLQFKKPKGKKSFQKKEKLDIDALEAEAVSAGLGLGDLGSWNDGKRHTIREEQERFEAEMRNNAYQSAYAKANEACKALQPDQTLTDEKDLPGALKSRAVPGEMSPPKKLKLRFL